MKNYYFVGTSKDLKNPNHRLSFIGTEAHWEEAINSSRKISKEEVEALMPENFKRFSQIAVECGVGSDQGFEFLWAKAIIEENDEEVVYYFFED